MAEPTLLKVSRVAVSDVDDSRRLRPVSEAGVESLIASVNELGVMKDPIHVRQIKGGGLVLIAGGHRLEAARRMGWDEIEAKVWTNVTDDWSRLMEIDDNLAGAEMNVLDSAVFLAERKRIYVKLHPETKQGVSGGLARQGLASDIVSFAAATAEKFSVSKRTIERLTTAGTNLCEDEVDLLRGASRPVTLKDLTELSKISADEERQQVVERLSSGSAKSAADARKSLAAGGVKTAVKDPVEEAFQALSKAWKRAAAVNRRRFVAEFFDDLSDLYSDEYERRNM